MELLVWSIIFFQCRQGPTLLECLWKLSILVGSIQSSYHILLRLLTSVIGLFDWPIMLILYSSSPMELLAWLIMLARCRQTHLECLLKLFMPVGSIQSSSSNHILPLLASVVGLLDWPAILILYSSAFESVQVPTLCLCPIAILCLCFALKLGWFFSIVATAVSGYLLYSCQILACIKQSFLTLLFS